jgi:uncharacterized protein YdhG (YjbR/CyaY superfamily)
VVTALAVERPSGVEAYLAGLPAEKRAPLEELRRVIRAAAPEAEEAVVYQMPGFRVHGRALVGYAAFKDHCSFFPMSGALVDAFAAELQGFETTKGSIHFTQQRPLPAALVARIVRARVAEIRERKAR